MSGEPFSKERQLGRGQRRYRRKVASPKQWQAIIAAKIGPCRVCSDPCSNGRLYGRVTFHHIVPRDWHGDDVADNIAPLCSDCHWQIEQRQGIVVRALLGSLTDAEYAHAVGKVGEGFAERIYGVVFER